MRKVMKLKKQSKKAAAWGMTAAMCLSLLSASGQPAVMKSAETVSDETAVMLENPVIEAEEGKVVWDCVYFGNYWQKEYVSLRDNELEEGEADVECVDSDGTKYIVRADKKCYKYEPVKWRVLSVSEDGTDAFLMADKILDGQIYLNEADKTDTLIWNTVTWETSSVRK